MNVDGVSGVGIRLFLGKGGVGKTTCAAATSLHFAEAGERTLVTEVPLFPQEIRGLERLRQVAAVLGPEFHDR